MIVVDSSCVLAILQNEPEKDGFEAALAGGDRCVMSAVNVHEADGLKHLRAVFQVRHGAFRRLHNRHRERSDAIQGNVGRPTTPGSPRRFAMTIPQIAWPLTPALSPQAGRGGSRAAIPAEGRTLWGQPPEGRSPSGADGQNYFPPQRSG